ncbi:MAG: hydrogenase iron-sulfur subunit [Deltaproteobacteria bacterium]|nr:hydrogenase iron-sulfur subunit [Deltaproteobacteria bacterium]
MADPHGDILVVGAGPAGLAAAIQLSDIGRSVILLERLEHPGGRAREVQASSTRPEDPASALEQMAREALARPGVELVAPARLENVEGRAGAFTAVIRPGGGTPVRRGVGVVIVATGAVYHAPGTEGPLTGYASFEALLHSAPADTFPRSVGFLADPMDVGEMLAQHAILDACLVRENRGGDAYVFLRHVPVRGWQGQSLYERALEAGVRFFRTDDAGASVSVDGDSAVVGGRDLILDRPFEIRCDLVVRGGPPEPARGTFEAAEALGMQMEEDRFLAPANVTFLPSRTAREGVLAAGACVGDMGFDAAMRSGRMAALQAHDLLSRTLPSRTPDDVTIDTGKCVACLTCLRLCPYHAIGLGEDAHYPSISDTDCHDCGLCAGACPQRAIRHHGLPDEVILERAGGATALVLGCERSACAAVDTAREGGLDVPESVRIVPVPCAGIVSTNLIMQLLLSGVESLAVMGCCDENCQNRRGSRAAERRVGLCRSILQGLGADPSRVSFHAVASNMTHTIARRIREMGP